ncbi:MAG: hypothetical protein KGL15_08905, partial [Acidobacteriota bacterium]|nr:hypothetical protein [Acidobacteriota bacterium]
RAGDGVALGRPLVNGPPASITDDAALLAYLDGQHRSYQLTTDVALAEGRGPSLVDRWGVLLPDGERFIPAALGSVLRDFVKAGGRVLALGIDALQGTSRLSGAPGSSRAAAPSIAKADIFGAVRAPVTSTGGELITELTDQLGIFGGLGAFSGFSRYQPIQAPTGASLSAAGIANGSPAIVGFSEDSGAVIEVGLPDFGASLSGNVDSQALMTSVWHLLAKQA